MELIYSALLLHSTGQKLNEANVKKVLESAGAKVDEAKIKALVASLEGVNIEETIKQAAVPVAAPAGAKEEAKGEDEAKKAEEEAKESEDAASGLASLFG